MEGDAISVGDALLRRGIAVEGKCKRCGAHETSLHLFLQCPFARKIWDLAPVMLPTNLTYANSVSDLLKEGIKMINLPPTGLSQPLFPWVLWNLWTSRNQFLFEDKKYSEEEVILKATKDAREWLLAQSPKPSYSPAVNPPPRNGLHRSVSADTINCYSDGAWLSASSKGGMGWIHKNQPGITLRKLWL